MKSTIHTRAFTLVELLVTMGLMAMLATIAIAGYYGAVRGMTERGAKQDVASLVRLAQQRALVDEVPTAVFLMNNMPDVYGSEGPNPRLRMTFSPDLGTTLPAWSSLLTE